MSKVTLLKNEHSSLPRDIPIVVDNTIPTECLVLRTDTHDLTINFKTGKTSRTKRVKFEPLPNYGSHMTWAEFCESVTDGGFDDEDGSGTLATATEISNVNIQPSRLGRATREPIPQPHPWATHVVWFNK